MNVLIVEDDENKREQIVDFLAREPLVRKLDVAKSYHSAIMALSHLELDLIILDMTLPTYDITPTELGGRTRVFGGKEILQRMKTKGYKGKVIVVTQFEAFGEGSSASTLDQLRIELHNSYPDKYIGTVFYSAARDNWKSELSAKIRKLKPSNI